jgi:hypothetical protein
MFDPMERKQCGPHRRAHLIRICKAYATKKKINPSIMTMATVEMLAPYPTMRPRLRPSQVRILSQV